MLIILPSSTHFEDKSSIDKLIETSPYYRGTTELIPLLQNVGAIFLNPDSYIFEFKPFFQNNKKRIIPILLGYIAEAIVVQRCNSSSNEK
ncbi:MAG: hypothetical protein PT120_25500 [Aphanizomenon gracile PMC649.10]|nr:hypothetical protein [Aphanizomenon gracile PMC649.10]